MDKKEKKEIEELKKAIEDLKASSQTPQFQQPCPSCGRCPVCGKGGNDWTWPSLPIAL